MGTANSFFYFFFLRAILSKFSTGGFHLSEMRKNDRAKCAKYVYASIYFEKEFPFDITFATKLLRFIR